MTKPFECPSCHVGVIAPQRVAEPVERMLPDIIADGFERGTCDHCGESVLIVLQAKPLSALWLGELIRKPRRLAPNEVKALRAATGERGEAVAKIFGVTPSQFSRWESGAKPISSLGDRLLRMFVALKRKLPAPAETFQDIDDSTDEPLRLRLEHDGTEWQLAMPSKAKAITKRPRSKRAA